MTTRTRQTVVRFSDAFMLPGFDHPQPGGDYRVDHDEELVDGASRLVWHRTATFIFLPALTTTNAAQQMVPVTPSDLDAALERDQSSS